VAASRRFAFKTVADAVHGSIGLSKVEVAVIDTAAFRRLRDVKQLGLAYVVYPTLDYSRFSHSLGTCHVAGRLYTHILLEKNEDEDGQLTKDEIREIQLHRLAGLLHDVGHYPFSHALETAVADYYSGSYLKGTGRKPSEPIQFFEDHEDVGRCILECDSELRSAIGDNDLGITADDIIAFFQRPSADEKGADAKSICYKGLISSDIDADRLDYLLRTAKLSGLPYGQVDLDYIVSQVRLDGRGKVAFGRNALRALDQVLIGRFFDYRQISFHKTVAAMEWLLVQIIPALLHIDKGFDLSKDGIIAQIRNQTWGRVTDAYVSELIARHLKDARDVSEEVREKNSETHLSRQEMVIASALVERRPPKLVAGIERFQRRRDRQEPNLHRLTVKMATDLKNSWAEHFGIPPERWTVWQRKIQITRAGAKVSASRAFEGGEKKGELTDVARLMIDDDVDKSAAIVTVPQSLTSILSEYDYRIIRIFVLFDDSLQPPEAKELRNNIFRRISEDMKDAGWTYPNRVSGSEDSEPFEGDDGEAGEGEDDTIGEESSQMVTSPTITDPRT
jgi:HD superfamily phosphohydrolase